MAKTGTQQADEGKKEHKTNVWLELILFDNFWKWKAAPVLLGTKGRKQFVAESRVDEKFYVF